MPKWVVGDEAESYLIELENDWEQSKERDQR